MATPGRSAIVRTACTPVITRGQLEPALCFARVRLRTQGELTGLASLAASQYDGEGSFAPQQFWFQAAAPEQLQFLLQRHVGVLIRPSGQ